MNGATCKDTRPCFAKKGNRCGVLTKGYEKDGACPFAKPDREVTDGKRYPYSPNYSQYGKNKAEDEDDG